MKIELITMHRVVNYGSVLQTFATQQVISKMGYQIEILDYYPKRCHALGMLGSVRHKVKGRIKCCICRIVLIPSYLKRFYVFKKFVREKLNISTRQFTSIEELKKDYPEADVYCTGSDQVWNSTWSMGIDPTYYLDFLPDNKKRIAYAASIGKSQISDWEKKEIYTYLKKYEWISMRETSAKEILHKMNIATDVVIDPTLLMKHEEWMPYVSKRYQGKKYILVYNLNREKTVDKMARTISKILNISTYYVGYSFHEMYKGSKYICNPKVEDFLSLIENAEFIIGDSFHMSAFSINFHKKFVSVCPEKFSIRIHDLLVQFNLQDRLIDSSKLDISLLENIVFSELDYIKIEEMLSTYRTKAKDLLEHELNKVNEHSE